MKQDKIDLAIEHLYELNVQFKEQERIYKTNKELVTNVIRRYFEENKINSFRVKRVGKLLVSNLVCKLVKNTKVIFDIGKLEKRLGKDSNAFIDKEYTINDMQGLVRLLKEYGVNPKKFKKFIDVDKKVNQEKLNQLSDLGALNEEDLDGCYEVKELSSYLRVGLDK